MQGDQLEDALVGARAGEEWAFRVLYRALNPALLRYFAARAPGVAEDLASETWLGAARTLASFAGDGDAFRGWLFTIAHRRLVQHWRDTTRRPSQVSAPADLEDHPAGDDTEVPVVARLDAVIAARRLAATLPAAEADVVLLRVLAGLDVDQVAGILGKRPETVRVLQHKALRRLARTFSLEELTQ